MKTALVLHNGKEHFYRLIQSLVNALQLQVHAISSSEFVYQQEGNYDLVFIAACMDLDELALSKIKYKHLFLFDCEDDPRHFNPGSAYENFKDKASAYVKYTWVDNHNRPDKLKNIGFPPANFWELNKIAKQADIHRTYMLWSKQMPVGYFSPTFIGSYLGNANDLNQPKRQGVNPIGVWEDGMPMFNQRIAWLESLCQAEIKYDGGLVFGQAGTNMSKEWQTKYFGEKIIEFEKPRISYWEYIRAVMYAGIGLNPTGHARISYRTFDLMATGCIMINTDFGEEKTFLMPKEGITVKDDEQLSDILIKNDLTSYKSVYLSSKNTECFLNKTPEILYNDFIKQI